MRSASELIPIDYGLGQLRDHMSRYSAVLAAGQNRIDANAPEVLDLRLNAAWGHHLLGDWLAAVPLFRGLLADLGVRKEAYVGLLGRTAFHYGQLLSDLARPVEAQEQLRVAIDQLTLALGGEHGMVAEAHAALGKVLADSGDFSSAKVELDRAHEIAVKWSPVLSWTEIRPRFFTALMLIQQDQPAKADPILANIVQLDEENEAAYLEAHKGSTVVLDHTGPVRQALGEAYAREGRLTESVATLRRAVDVGERANGPTHPQVISARLSLAESMLADRREAEANMVFAALPPFTSVSLPADHLIVAQWHRVHGLLELGQNNVVQARDSLQRAYEIYQSVYGDQHWRTLRARRELLLAANSGAPQ